MGCGNERVGTWSRLMKRSSYDLRHSESLRYLASNPCRASCLEAEMIID
jgi:hypothetical protein